MICEYEVVSDHDLALLKSTVNEMLALGWQPSGNLVVSDTSFRHGIVSLYTQVMVKHDAS